jgi:hypothetical protein
MTASISGARGGEVGSGTALQAGRSGGSIPDGNFFIDIILTVTLWPWVDLDLVSNRNEYQEYFLGSKGRRCVGLKTLPSTRTESLEIWEPQPPGTLRACPGL